MNETLALQRYVAQLRWDQRSGTNPYPGLIPAQMLSGVLKSQIAQTSVELNRARRAAQDLPLGIEQGEAHAVGTIPLQSVFALHTEVVSCRVTALRVEVPPKDVPAARHTPEDGFIVDRVDAWAVSAAGDKQKIEFRYFAPDSQENLAEALRPRDGPPSGFAANSKLFQPRWVIAVPKDPLLLCPGGRLEVQLTHTQMLAAKPAPAKRVRLSTSSDDGWTDLGRDESLTAKLTELHDIERRLAQIPGVTVPVMTEEPESQRRETLEFERGNFLTQIGGPLLPDVPALFPKLPAKAPRNRLTMARWFFDPRQPLTARVAVNRYWEQLFGMGIVETLEDFGSAGTPPSHPELLDWLATHFQNELRWDMKALLRELVTSATYRQSAKVTRATAGKDPNNRLLSHGPQQRLTAEMVRDQALSASGLLSPALGGPPAMPPQPAGVWMTVYNSSQWIDAKGPERYRRAIYTYLKRSAIYPSLVTFDASDHVVSLPRRIPTNTPLQALVTLNDPVYVEAAEALAGRMLRFVPTAASGTTVASRADLLNARLNHAAQCVLSRDLSPKELAALALFYEDVYRAAPGLSPPPGRKDLAAFTAVAGVLFNLDSALTR
jgi:hypothetical protein